MPPFVADALTWPGNRAYITSIKTARAWGVPPTVLILNNRQPSDGWSYNDKKLAIALQILEDETCPECGIPIWLAHNDDENIVFEMKTQVCYSCATVETGREKEENRKGKRKPTKGKKHFIQTQETEHLPTRRAFYEAQAGVVE